MNGIAPAADKGEIRDNLAVVNWDPFNVVVKILIGIWLFD